MRTILIHIWFELSKLWRRPIFFFQVKSKDEMKTLTGQVDIHESGENGALFLTNAD